MADEDPKEAAKHQSQWGKEVLRLLYSKCRRQLDDLIYYIEVSLHWLGKGLIVIPVFLVPLHFFGARVGFYLVHNLSYLSRANSLPEGDGVFFKYGSIGDEAADGMPKPIWDVLLSVCPRPEAEHETFKTPEELYAHFGLIKEENHKLPVGFSKRKVSILGLPFTETERISINCALCHTATYRIPVEPIKWQGVPEFDDQVYAKIDPRYKRQWRKVVPGGPAHQFTAQEGLKFLTGCAKSLTASHIIEKQGGSLFAWKNLSYYFLAPITRQGFLERREQFAFVERQPPWGYGRFDAMNGGKIRLLEIPYDESIGTVDIPAIWRLDPNHARNWDGNHLSLLEAIQAEALITGVPKKTLASVKDEELARLQDYLQKLPPPKYPPELPFSREQANKGEPLYNEHCAKCHGKKEDGGPTRLGEVIPLAEVGTDSYRLRSWTQEAVEKKNKVRGFGWQLSESRKTDGYVAVPLDGIWLRAPYLHNGSVPTLHDLLQPPEQRPRQFYRGYDVLDAQKVGFIANVAEEPIAGGIVRKFSLFNTLEPGNGNGGHLFGTTLPQDEKENLLEYLKTL